MMILSVFAFQVSVAVLFLSLPSPLLRIFSTSRHQPWQSQHSSTAMMLSTVNAQHPVVKFIQMHTAMHRRNMNMNMIGSTDSVGIDISATTESDNDLDGSGSGAASSESDSDETSHQDQLSQDELQQDQQQHMSHEECQVLQERVTDVTQQLLQSEQSLQEMKQRSEQLQQQYDTSLTSHSKHVEELQETIQTTTQQMNTQLQEQLQQHNDAHEKLSHEYQTVQQQHQAIQSDAAICKGETNAMQTQLLRLEQKYELLLKDYETSLQSYINEHFQSAVENHTQLALQTQQESFHVQQQKCDTSIQQLQQQILNMSQTLIDAQHECDGMTQSLQHELIQQKESLDEEYMMQQKEWSTILQQTQDVYDANLRTLRQSLSLQCNETLQELYIAHNHTSTQYEAIIHNFETNILPQLTTLHQAQIRDYEAKVNKTQDEYYQLQQSLHNQTIRLQQLQTNHNHTLQSLHYWEEAFQQRSYLNTTYIGNDIQQYGNTLLDLYLPPLVDRMKRIYQEQFVRPYIVPCYNYYTLNILPHIRILHNRYNEHLHPYVHPIMTSMHLQCQTYILPTVYDIHDAMLEWYHNTLVEGVQQMSTECIEYYRTVQCPNMVVSVPKLTSQSSLLSSSQQSTRTSTNSTKSTVASQMIQYSCDFPIETIEIGLKLILTFLCVIFHRSILRWSTYFFTTLVTILLWKMNPIRLLFRRCFGGGGRSHSHTSMSSEKMIVNGIHHATLDEDDLLYQN
jgi:hypothetical protein